jgi:small subunit ribosomal protein S6
VIRFLTLKVDELEKGPSAMMRRNERSERGDRGDRGDRGPRGDRGDRPDFRAQREVEAE